MKRTTILLADDHKKFSYLADAGERISKIRVLLADDQEAIQVKVKGCWPRTLTSLTRLAMGGTQ